MRTRGATTGMSSVRQAACRRHAMEPGVLLSASGRSRTPQAVMQGPIRARCVAPPPHAIRNAAAFQDWPGIPLGASVRPCSHSLNCPAPSALAPRSACTRLGPRAGAPARLRERRYPEAADERPDAAVVVLPGEVLAVPRHVRPPQASPLADRIAHRRAPGTGRSRWRASSARNVRCAAASSARPHSTASTLPNMSPSSPKNEKLTKLKIQVAVARLRLRRSA